MWRQSPKVKSRLLCKLHNPGRLRPFELENTKRRLIGVVTLQERLRHVKYGNVIYSPAFRGSAVGMAVKNSVNRIVNKRVLQAAGTQKSKYLRGLSLHR